MKKNVIDIVLIITAAILQITVIHALPSPLSYMNVPLAIIIIFIITEQYTRSLYWSFLSGLLIGLFTFNRFGIDAFIFIIISILINFLFNNVFTNASMVSLTLLGIIAQFIYISLSRIISMVLYYVKLESLRYNYVINIKLFLMQIIVNIILLIVAYKTYSLLLAHEKRV